MAVLMKTTSATPPDSRRPDVVDLAVEGLERVAVGSRHRQARNRHRLAPPRVSWM